MQNFPKYPTAKSEKARHKALEKLLNRQQYKYAGESSFESDHNPSILLWIDPSDISLKYQLLVLINEIQYTAIMTEDDFYYFLDLVNDETNDKLPIMYARKCENCFELHLYEGTSHEIFDMISHKFVADKLSGLHDEDSDYD